MAGDTRAAVRMGVAFIAMAAVSAASLLLPDTSTEIPFGRFRSYAEHESIGGSSVIEIVGDTPPSASVLDIEEPFGRPGCFDVVSTAAKVLPVAIECGQVHRYQAFGSVDLDGSLAYDLATAQAVEDCQSGFEDFVGVEYSSSLFIVAPMMPPRSSWPDRMEVTCVLFIGSEVTWTGNAEGSGF